MIRQDRQNSRIVVDFPITGTITSASHARIADVALSSAGTVESASYAAFAVTASALTSPTNISGTLTGVLNNSSTGIVPISVSGTVKINGSAGALILNEGAVYKAGFGNITANTFPTIQADSIGGWQYYGEQHTFYNRNGSRDYLVVRSAGLIPSGVGIYDIGSISKPFGTLHINAISASAIFGGVQYNSLLNVPTGIISSSTQINALSGVSSSYAQTASVLLGSIESASYATVAQNVLGSIASSSYAAFAATANSSSYALTASFALNGGGGPSVSSSFATTASYATVAQNVLGSITSASYALTASYALNGGSGGGGGSGSGATNVAGMNNLITQPAGTNGNNAWTFLGGVGGIQYTTVAYNSVSNTFYAVPFFSPPSGGLRVITELGFFRSNLVNSYTMSFAIYTNRGNGSSHPDRLVRSGTLFTGGSGGVFPSTTLSGSGAELIPNSLYWFVMNATGSSNPTMTAIPLANALAIGTITGSATNPKVTGLTSGSNYSNHVFPTTVVGNWTPDNSSVSIPFPLFNGTT